LPYEGRILVVRHSCGSFPAGHPGGATLGSYPDSLRECRTGLGLQGMMRLDGWMVSKLGRHTACIVGERASCGLLREPLAGY